MRRTIIGQIGKAGMPISAEVIEGGDQFPKVTIRWRLRGDYFVLEQWRLENPKGPTRGIWVEVGCFVG